ncbi:MAG TPA: chemotaxis protein CheA, partial [Terracidiphilus sp.]|nr:chemotaxis protein CheA [Terracidiphilus sp.]
MDDLIQEFLAESREGLDRMDVCLTALEERPRDKDLLGEIFRAVHTMKGATGFLGYPRLEQLAHTGETLLSLMRDGMVVANEAIINVLFQLTDRLREVIDLIERIGREGNRARDDDTEMIAMLERLQGRPAEPDADLLALMAQVGVEIGAERREAALPEAAEVPSEAPPKALMENENRDAESTVRVDVQVLDRMVHLVGELVLTRNQLLKKCIDESSALLAAERLDTLTQELRQTVMQARMLPLAQLFQRFPRMVRDLAKVCSKSVRIEFAGQETALDRSLIEAIKDPLTHMLRNAIDHGIESACDRFTAGKPAEGVVRLSARQQGGWVVIEICDDGAGIAKQRLIARAIERRRLTEEQADLMSDREVMDLVFEPGFSTAAAVTHISGRGVGMDVVRSQVERVGGSVEVESEVGVGTVVRLRIPLTLAIVPVWTVRVGDRRFCIPQNA